MLNIKNKNERTENIREHRQPLLNVRREDILYRDDIKTSFAYALVGLTLATIALGGIYVIGNKLIS